MVLEAIVARYGLLAVLVGAGLEGEAVVIAGGVLAQRGLIPLLPAALCAILGSFAVDQLWFQAGRKLRRRAWLQKLANRPASGRAIKALERHQIGFILSFRFIYGMRTISPIAIGTSQIRTRKFLLLNLIAAAVWGPLFTLLGYALGHAALPLVEKFGPLTLGICAAIAVAALVVSWVVSRMKQRSARPAADESSHS
jgi:membrane protein DedA with SNARE-associated domain